MLGSVASRLSPVQTGAGSLSTASLAISGIGGRVLACLLVGGVAGALGLAAILVASLPMSLAVVALILILGPFVVLVVGNVQRLLLAVILLDTPFQVDTHLNYRLEPAAFGAIGGINVSITTLAMVALYVIWITGLLTRVGSPPRPNLRASLPLAAYLLSVVASWTVAHDVELASFEAILLGQMFLLFVYVASTVRTRQDVVFVVTLLMAGMMLEGLLMLAVRVAGGDAGLGLPGRVDVSDVAASEYQRLSGTIGAANSAAAYFSLLIPVSLAVLLTDVGRWHKRLAILTAVFGVVALTLTLSRGGLMALGIGGGMLCLLAIWRGWLSPAVPLAVAGLLAVAAFLFQDIVLVRFMGEDMGSAHSRVPLMMLALRIVEDHPLLGIGPNNFAVVMFDYVTPEFSDYGGEWLYVVHNNYLRVLAETGIGGLAAYIWFLVAAVVAGWKTWQRGDRLLAAIALGLSAGIAGHMVHLSVDMFNDRPQVQNLWLIGAVIVAIGRIRTDERTALNLETNRLRASSPQKPARGALHGPSTRAAQA